MVNSVAYGEPWPGTSASAPHVSGAAALILQAFPDYSPDQVIEFLESRAVDLGDDGSDNIYGYGRLWLGEPPGSVSSPLPTEETEPIMPEETATLSSGKIATPTHHPTEAPSSPESSKAKFTLGLLTCVVLPGVLGMGGIGLLGGVLYAKRTRRTGSSLEPMLTDASFGFPAVLPEEQIAPQMERGDTCPRCGSSRRSEARFCMICGYQFKSEKPAASAIEYCTNCGQALRRDSKFCMKCGMSRKKPTF